MYEFWRDYVKPKYGEKTKFCYIDTNSFIIYIKTDDLYKDITEDLNQIDHCLKGTIEINGLMRDELGLRTLTKFVGLGAITYNY